MLRKNKVFLEYLLNKNTPLIQKQALIFTASDTQLNSVSEIIHNLNAGIIRLSNNCKALLKKTQKVVKENRQVFSKAFF